MLTVQPDSMSIVLEIIAEFILAFLYYSKLLLPLCLIVIETLIEKTGDIYRWCCSNVTDAKWSVKIHSVVTHDTA